MFRSLPESLLSVLKTVQKPSQYLGNEVNAVHKDFNKALVRVVLVFPDAYEIGMSHTGLKILYDILNHLDGVVAERCFAPLLDMENRLRQNNMPLFSLESKTPLKEFDIIGVSLPYELTFTNLLNAIDLAQLPLLQKERCSHHPLIVAGGTQSYNPEPVANFLDAVAIGDGEELVLDLVQKIKDWKKKFNIDRVSDNANQISREALLESLTEIEGMYVPKYFEPVYNPDGTIKEILRLQPGYTSVKKRIVKDLNKQPYPTKVVVPHIKPVHDRVGIEIQRGCTRMCRFCQAGFTERPVRQRDPDQVIEIAKSSIQNTGLDEISFLSLSAGDYANLVPTLKELNQHFEGQNVSISVPSTRTETLTKDLIKEVKQVRMTGFTIAPEAGSERMRRVINKGNKFEDLLQACENAFAAGYKLIKFYYMCGLPFETDEDLLGIARETHASYETGRKYNPNSIQLNVSVSSFVPKPFTPFQWEPQMTLEETRRKLHLIKSNLRYRAIKFKHHQPEMSWLEGLFSRGDRRLGRLIQKAFENGCRFDEWKEHFDFDKWQGSIAETGIDTEFYLHRQRSEAEILPWDHLYSQMKKDWLWQEALKAREEAFTADCSQGKCASFCGVCDFKGIKNTVIPLGAREHILCAGSNGESSIALKPAGTDSRQRLASDSEEIEKHTPPQRLRVHFIKTNEAALMGHLELMSVLKRAIARNNVPVCFSEGFHPQMKLAMGYALPIGIESEHEFFDITLNKSVQVDDFISKMNHAMPRGLKLLSAEVIDLKTPSIYSATRSVSYLITFPETFSDQSLKNLSKGLSEFSQGKDFFVTRPKGKNKDKIKEISLKKYLIVKDPIFSINKGLQFSLLCDSLGTLKPTEVILALAGVTQQEVVALGIKKIGTSF